MYNSRKHKTAVWIAFGLFAFFLLYLTVLDRIKQPERTYDFVPFWSYALWFRGSRSLGIQIIENILVFVPFGFFLAAGIDGGKISGKRLAVKTAVYTCLFSVMIELTQLAFMLGHCDIDDVFDNTLGGAIGGLFYIWLRRRAKVYR